MAFDPHYRTAAVARGRPIDQAEIDQGLRSYMLRVYNYMALGVAFTGLIVLAMANMPQVMYTIAVGPLKWVLFIGIIGLGFLAPRLMMTKSAAVAHLCYWVYAGLWGALISPMVALFLYQGPEGQMMIARAFFITAGMFAGMSLFGYTTKRDLTGVGNFMFMGLIGIIIASIVNIFLASSALDFAISVIGVLVFVGLTAYDTQKIRNMYFEADSADVATKKAVMGALTLYLDFINLMIMLLRLFGERR